MDRVHRPWSAFGAWRTLGWSEASGASCRTSQPRPSAPCFAARIPGSKWRCSAGARRNGSAPFWTCSTAFPPATLPATCFPGWTRGSSRSVSLNWTRAVAALMPGEVAAIAGRTVRRHHGRAAVELVVHLVSAWASPELVEGQHADLGTGQDGGEIQRNHRHFRVAGNAGTGVERKCPTWGNRVVVQRFRNQN